MKRVMKFRAWDKRRKVWVSVGFHIFGETTLFGLIEIYCLENRETGECSLERMNDIEVTEFTGLKDKNGKDIYEGDILRLLETISSDDPAYPYYCETMDVGYSEPNCGFGLTDGGAFLKIPSNVEIIGNIYENPELPK